MSNLRKDHRRSYYGPSNDTKAQQVNERAFDVTSIFSAANSIVSPFGDLCAEPDPCEECPPPDFCVVYSLAGSSDDGVDQYCTHGQGGLARSWSTAVGYGVLGDTAVGDVTWKPGYPSASWKPFHLGGTTYVPPEEIPFNVDPLRPLGYTYAFALEIANTNCLVSPCRDAVQQALGQQAGDPYGVNSDKSRWRLIFVDSNYTLNVADPSAYIDYPTEWYSETTAGSGCSPRGMPSFRDNSYVLRKIYLEPETT